MPRATLRKLKREGSQHGSLQPRSTPDSGLTGPNSPDRTQAADPAFRT
jgi:hypothetical protein